MIQDRILRYVAGLRYPELLTLTFILFDIDLIIPGFIPFADEILLGLIALAGLKKNENMRGE